MEANKKRLLCAGVLCCVLAVSLAADGESNYFIHMTDQHLEWDYKEHTNPYNDHCRSTEPGRTGRYGDVACQSPYTLVQAHLREMSRMFPDPQFILVTGDFRRGFVTVGGREEVYTNIKNMTATLKAFYPNARVYPALGNHDVHPNEQHSPENTWLVKRNKKKVQT